MSQHISAWTFTNEKLYMRLLYITSSWFLDGDFPLIRELVRQGIDVHLVIKIYTNSLTSTILDLDEGYDKTGIFDSSIYGVSIDQFKHYLGLDRIHVINHTSSDNSISNISITHNEFRLIKKLSPDIIHFIGWPSLYEIPILAKYGKKIITTIHDPIPHVNSIKSKINILIRKLAYQSIGHFILLNKKQTKEFISLYGVKNEKLLFSRLGNFEILQAFLTERKLKSKTILFFGRISPYKGLEYLLEAYYSIKDDYPDSKLIIAGGGDYNFDISRYLDCNQIEFINEYIPIEKLSLLIQESAFVVCPYISATQSGVIASAYSLNKPVIATRVGGLSEMIIEGETGLLIEPRDSYGLKQAIKKMLDNPGIVAKMSTTIEENSKNGINSWTTIAKDYIKYYSNIAGNE